MPIKQSININFAKGLNTKTDKWQLPPGQFEALQNSVFTTEGRLTKRNGFPQLTVLPNTSYKYLTTLNNNLTAIGENIAAYSESTRDWFQKGTIQPMGLSVLPLIRNNANQTQNDTAIANGLVCIVYAQNFGGATSYYYAVSDQLTGQNIVPPTLIAALSSGAISGTSKVFVVSNFFVVVSPVTISGTTYLQYFSISNTNTSLVSVPQNVYAEAFVSLSSNLSWDGVVEVATNTLVVAYNTTSGAQGIHITTLTSQQITTNSASGVVHAFANAAYIGYIVSLCIDTTHTIGVTDNIVYVSFWNNSTTNAYTAAVTIGFGSIATQFTPKLTFPTVAASNLASAAQGGSCLVFMGVSQNYGYVAVPSNYVQAVTVSSAGTVGTPYNVVRSVGLASKAFIIDDTIYFLAAFQSPYQPSYFLINGTLSVQAAPVVTGKLAYENGGGYLTSGLPSVAVVGNVASISYLYKDFITSLSTQNNTTQTATGGIYSQTGINLANFTIGTQNIDTAEIANNLHITGGFLWGYDGYAPVEHNFFLFPDSVVVTHVDSGGHLDAQQYYYQAVYSWADNQGNQYRSAASIPVTVTTGATATATIYVPTLRLTYKIANPVKIELYRWSAANPAYYQVSASTSQANPVLAPMLNNLTVDYVTFTDEWNDSNIVGNNLLYTTGGVLPDFNAPASNILTLFDTRLWIVDAEDPNTLYFSKIVIEATPVEMCQAQTYYIAPNIGATNSSGPITALAPMDDKLIIFKKDYMCYINGQGPDATGANNGYSQPIFITSSVGSVEQQSIVLTPEGLQFQSDKGIFLLARNLSTQYIGAPVEAFNKSAVLSAVNVPTTTQIRFCLDTGEQLMYDYYYGQWGTFIGAPAISSCIYNGLHTLLNEYGQIWQETPGQYVDGLSNPVLLNFTTSWFNLASLQGYQRFYDFYILAKYESPHFIIASVAYNYNPSIYHQSTISPKNFSPSVPGPFGVPTPVGAHGNLEQWRIHAKQQLCQSFQLTIQEVFNPAFGTVPGAGFTMSGLNLRIAVKRSARPISESNAVG